MVNAQRSETEVIAQRSEGEVLKSEVTAQAGEGGVTVWVYKEGSMPRDQSLPKDQRIGSLSRLRG